MENRINFTNYINNNFSTPNDKYLFDFDEYQSIINALVSTGNIIIKATPEEIIYGTPEKGIIGIQPNGDEIDQMTGEVLKQRER